MSSAWRSNQGNDEQWLAFALGPSPSGHGHDVRRVAITVSSLPSETVELQWRKAASLDDLYSPDGGGSFELNTVPDRSVDSGDDAGYKFAPLGSGNVDGDVDGQRVVVPDLAGVASNETVAAALAAAATAPRTLEVWVKLLDAGAGRGHVVVDGLGVSAVALHDTATGNALPGTGGGAMAALGACAFRSAAGAPPLRRWMHVAAVWHGDGAGTSELYVDGVLVDAHNCSGRLVRAFALGGEGGDGDGGAAAAAAAATSRITPGFRRRSRRVVRVVYESQGVVFAQPVVEVAANMSDATATATPAVMDAPLSGVATRFEALGPPLELTRVGGWLAAGSPPAVLRSDGLPVVLAPMVTYDETVGVAAAPVTSVVDVVAGMQASTLDWRGATSISVLPSSSASPPVPSGTDIRGMAMKQQWRMALATQDGLMIVDPGSSNLLATYVMCVCVCVCVCVAVCVCVWRCRRRSKFLPGVCLALRGCGVCVGHCCRRVALCRCLYCRCFDAWIDDVFVTPPPPPPQVPLGAGRYMRHHGCFQ